jgi:metal transporter CNNM
MQLNKVPFVPNNESLLGILDRFQEGRSHMAIVSRLSVQVEKAVSMKKHVKKGLTQRLRERVGMGDSSSSDCSDSEDDDEQSSSTKRDENSSEGEKGTGGRKAKKKQNDPSDLEKGDAAATEQAQVVRKGVLEMSNLEQSMPADAVLTTASANEVRLTLFMRIKSDVLLAVLARLRSFYYASRYYYLGRRPGR